MQFLFDMKAREAGSHPRLFSRLPHYVAAALLTVAGLAMTGCTTGTQLRPAADANRVPGLDTAASDEMQNVSIVVDSQAWSGDPDVTTHVSPLRVDIQNDSDQPLRIRYNDFALVNELNGTRYAALPPYQIEGSVSERVTAVYDRPIDRIGFGHTNFHVSPYYTGIYPTIAYWRRPFHYDPFYYDHYFDYWAQIPLPTEEMLRNVLPEGVIDPGGSLSGFLYFERVPEDVESVQFRFELTSADNGERFGMITIPFIVNGEE